MALSKEIQDEIAAEVARSHSKRAALPEALKIVQRHRGYVSDQSVSELATLLEMTTDEVDSIATFYSLIYRHPVGRHVILLCDSVSCWILGYENLREHLFSRLGVEFGQTTGDGRFTLLPVVCLGACDKAPVMMIDDDLHVNLTRQKIDEILQQYH